MLRSISRDVAVTRRTDHSPGSNLVVVIVHQLAGAVERLVGWWTSTYLIQPVLAVELANETVIGELL